MPELPDVESFKKYFESTSLHKKIASVLVKSSQILDGVSEKDLATQLTKKSFLKCERYGKYLFAKTDDDLYLVLHFGMTGDLKCVKAPETPSYSRLMFCFTNGYCLSYNDQRKFGKVSLTANVKDFIHWKNLGPDALAIDYSAFQEIIIKGRGTAKFTFLDQHIIAGIGNIYADEILFQAGIHPQAKVNQLDERMITKLFLTMKHVLSTAIDLSANSLPLPNNYLIHYRYKGAKCPLDKQEIKAAKVAGRTTYFCPKHQKLQIAK